jgi:hypothetical protein
VSRYFPVVPGPAASAYDAVLISPSFLFISGALISFGMMLYAFHQLLRFDPDRYLYEVLAFPVILISLSGSVSTAAFMSGYVAFALIFTIIAALTSLFALHRIKNDRHLYRYYSGLSHTFSALTAWLLVVLAIEFTMWGIASGFAGMSASAMLALGVVALFITGLWLGANLHDTVIPSFAALSLFSVWLSEDQRFERVSLLSLIASAVLISWVLVYAYRTYQAQRKTPCYTGRSVMKIVR